MHDQYVEPVDVDLVVVLLLSTVAMSPSDRVAMLAASLTAVPTHAEILDLAEAIAQVAARSPKQPGRSVALFVRHHLGERPKVLKSAISSAAHQRLARGDLHVADITHEWLTISETAAKLGLPRRMIELMLKTVTGRRALGWPMHIGDGDFLIRREAVGEDRSTYLSGLAVIEPVHPVELPGGWAR